MNGVTIERTRRYPYWEVIERALYYSHQKSLHLARAVYIAAPHPAVLCQYKRPSEDFTLGSRKNHHSSTLL
jgi:hypothetical protein